MALTILATGDIHIGKKSSGIKHNTEESATKYTWSRIVDYAIKSKVDILALTGDIIDQDNRYFEAIGPLQAGFEKLKQANISVFMVAGNHDFDVLPQLVNSERYNNVHLLGAKGKWETKVFSKNSEQLQLVGWSFPSRHVSEDPLLKFNPAIISPNITTIGLVHGDVDTLNSKYAPISLNNFLNTSVDAWILGHIHKPQILRSSTPIVYYPGSPHALSAKEQGVHGPILLTVQPQRDIVIEEIPLSPVRYETLSVDITDKNNEEEVRNAITSKLYEDAHSKDADLENVSYLVYDVVLIGNHSNIREVEMWVKFINDYELEISTTETLVLVRKTELDIQPQVTNMEELAKESSPAGVLAKWIIALKNGESTEATKRLLQKWGSVHSSITQASTYQPLRTTDRFEPEQQQDKKQYILNECKRILTELISQQEQ